MKIIRKIDGSVIGHTSTKTPDIELQNLGLNSDEYELEKTQSELNTEALLFLSESDWQVVRHRDQLDSGTETSLTQVEYENILILRQQARESVVLL